MLACSIASHLVEDTGESLIPVDHSVSEIAPMPFKPSDTEICADCFHLTLRSTVCTLLQVASVYYIDLFIVLYVIFCSRADNLLYILCQYFL